MFANEPSEHVLHHIKRHARDQVVSDYDDVLSFKPSLSFHAGSLGLKKALSFYRKGQLTTH